MIKHEATSQNPNREFDLSRAVPQVPPSRKVRDEALQRSFEKPPADARIMMRWWWFGPAVTKTEIEREMRVMKEGGIGGFEVQATYPLELEDATNGIKILPYLSDEFIEMLRFTSVKARETRSSHGSDTRQWLAIRRTYGRIDHAAGALERVKVGSDTRRVPIPKVLLARGKIHRRFSGADTEKDIDPDSVRELTDIKDDAVWLPATFDGSYEVMFFISGRAGNPSQAARGRWRGLCAKPHGSPLHRTLPENDGRSANASFHSGQ